MLSAKFTLGTTTAKHLKTLFNILNGDERMWVGNRAAHPNIDTAELNNVNFFVRIQPCADADGHHPSITEYNADAETSGLSSFFQQCSDALAVHENASPFVGRYSKLPPLLFPLLPCYTRECLPFCSTVYKNAPSFADRLSIVCPIEAQYRPKYGLLICEAGIVDLRRIMASWGEHPDSLGCGPFVASIHPGAKLTAIKHANSVEFYVDRA